MRQVMLILLQEKKFGPNHILRFRNTFEIKSGGRLYPEALFIGRPSLSVVPGLVLKDLFIGFNRKSILS